MAWDYNKTAKSNLYIKFDDDYTLSLKKSDSKICGVGVTRKRKASIDEDCLDKYLIKKFWHPTEDLPKKFSDFLDKLQSRLSDEEFIKRNSQPLISASVPEMWSDPDSMKEFSNSFFEYIEYKIRGSSKPLVVKSIMKACKINDVDDAATIKSKMESFLKKNHWTDDYWINA